MLGSFDDVIAFARSVLSEKHFSLLLADDPKYHAPMWHTYGVLGHMFAVYETSKKLGKLTGINVARAALYHDTGKIHQFADAVGRVERQEDPSLAYRGHEPISARVAARDKLSPISVAAIAAHAMVYGGAKPETIYGHLGSKSATAIWIVLCACDAAGKGFTPEQIEQRPKIPMVFGQVARLAGIEPGDRVMVRSCDAVLNWPLIPVPKFT